MGKTVPSYRQAIEAEIKRWRGFKKALRRQEREAFQEMMNACRKYASAAGMATRPVLFESLAMSILLSQQRTIQKLRETIDRLTEQLSRP
ncbi:MAG: hypothetical protein ACOC6G_02610 [Thermoproteota archaeon]